VDIEALGERQHRQDLFAILLGQIGVEAGAPEQRHRRRALAKQVVGIDLDQRPGRARRDARLIAVRDAVIALVRDPAGPRDPTGAGPELERILLLEPLLEALLEQRRIGLDVDHVDRAVRARLSARGAPGARRLVDDDFLLDLVELDRVVGARIDAPLIGARAARIDEVQHAELVAAEREPPSAVALLARLLAQLAIDAELELANAHHLARDADALADEEIE